jgi:hypothetical protein
VSEEEGGPAKDGCVASVSIPAPNRPRYRCRDQMRGKEKEGGSQQRCLDAGQARAGPALLCPGLVFPMG